MTDTDTAYTRHASIIRLAIDVLTEKLEGAPKGTPERSLYLAAVRLAEASWLNRIETKTCTEACTEACTESETDYIPTYPCF